MKTIIRSFGVILLLILLFLFSFWINLSPVKLTAWVNQEIGTKLNQEGIVQFKNVQTRIWGVSADSLTVSVNPSASIKVENIKRYFNPYSIILAQGIPLSADLYTGRLNLTVA